MDEKRIGDQREKFLVASMTERQKKIAQFKAHKTVQSIDDLVIAAVDQLDILTYLKVPCPECGAEILISKKPFIYTYNEDQEVKVVNYPESQCDCKGDKSDFYAENYLEDLVAFEIQQTLKEGREVPSEMDLLELLKMDS